MAPYLLILDKESESFLKSKGLISGQDFKLVRPSKSDLEVYIERGGFDMIVYASPSGKKLAKSYLKRHPSCPSIVTKKAKALLLGRGDVEISIGKNDSVDVITKSLLEFFKVTQKSMGEQSQFSVSELISNIHENVQPGSISSYFEQVLGLLSESFHCRSAYWLGKGEYDYFVRQMWKVQRLHSSSMGLSEHPDFISANGSTPEDLSDLLQKLQGSFPEKWEELPGSFRMKGGRDVLDWTVVLPVTDKKSGKHFGHILLVSPQGWPLPRTHSIGHKRLGNAIAHGYQFASRLQEMEQQSYRDDVTDLYNQRYLQIALDKEIDRSQRNETPFSVLFIDLDHFKKVNDTKGHLVGSRVLVEVGREMGKLIRASDYGFRYGGDEFLLLLVGMNSQSAAKVAERIRRTIEDMVFDINGVEIKVTLSIGVASFPEHAETKEEIVRLADEAMYYGKHKSRNIVFVAS